MSIVTELEKLKLEKDNAYWERNQLVAYLSKVNSSWLEKHPSEDIEWENDWRNIVFIEFLEGLFSWHIHDSDLVYFDHLKTQDGNSWDGKTTIQKYDSLRKKI